MVLLEVAVQDRPVCGADGSSSAAAGRKLTGKKWIDMDYGPYLTASIEAPEPAGNIAYKGLMISVDPETDSHVLFDTDLLRYAAGWTGGKLNWTNVVYDGSHTTHPSIAGEQHFGNGMRPGWGKSGTFRDPRKLPYGPLPRGWAHYKGLFLHGNRVVLSYTVGKSNVLERPGLEKNGRVVAFSRTFDVGASGSELTVQIAEQPGARGRVVSRNEWLGLSAANPQFSQSGGSLRSTPATRRAATAADHVAVLGTLAGDLGEAAKVRTEPVVSKAGLVAVGIVGGPAGLEWQVTNDSCIRLRIPPAATPSRFKVLIWRGEAKRFSRFLELLHGSHEPADLRPLTQGGPPRWPQKLNTRGKPGDGRGAYTIDTITAPNENPWNSWMRFGGFDFFAGGRKAAICTWNGDVWIVSGLGGTLEKLTWQRIATGLFQPLGLKIVDEQIYLCCRDQITRLHDLNGDGETDFYENFNNDHQVTEHFHEFAMDLQTDADGNFYYAKCARHAKDAVVPQHGTLLKVSRDGKTTEILCNGFRAANGVGIGPNGELVASDQEGHWTPANRINLVQPGGFYGNMWSYHRGKRPTTYDPPICWLPVNVDRSPAEQLWVESDRWGPLGGSLISTSYGTGQIFLVMYERIGGQVQGGAVRFPFSFPTGIMRGRFHPGDGQLYVCGLFGWSSDKTLPGGFYRVRYTGRPVHLPVELHAAKDGIAITFTEPLDRQAAEDVDNYSLKQWNYLWTANYGSKHYRVSDPKTEGFDRVEVRSAMLSEDGRTVFLQIDELQPVMQMQISYTLHAADGSSLRQDIYSTINVLGKPRGTGARPVMPIKPRPLTLTKAEQQRLRPGLLLRFEQTAGKRKTTDARQARLAALHVPANSAPTPFLQPGRFRATFDGYVRLDLKGRYTFRLKGSGSAMLGVNGTQVLGGRGVLSRIGPATVSLHKGYNKLTLQYESPDHDNKSSDRSDATVRLYWSSDSFTTEPIPPAVLWHDGTDDGLPAGQKLRLGRELFATRSCSRCHALPSGMAVEELAMPEMQKVSPSLERVGARLNEEWMYRWILDPRAMRNNVTMPRLLHGNTENDRQQAAHVAAYLAGLGKTQTTKARRPSDEAVQTGEILFEDLGCIGCHTMEKPDSRDEFSRTSLHYVGGKFRPGALRAFLQDPRRNYQWSRMPHFLLEERKAAPLAAYLRATSASSLPGSRPFERGDPVLGRQLFEQTGCAACHSLGNDKPLPQPTLATLLGSARERGCLAPDGQAMAKAPDFRFSSAERQALVTFLKTDGRSLRYEVASEVSRRYVRTLNCTACHKRDAQNGDWPLILAEEGTQGRPAEIVPDLTWAGEKLKPQWIGRFLDGTLPYRPRPWLKIKMPVFAARARQLADGMSQEHGFGWNEAAEPALEPGMVEIGRRLTLKDKGFDCVQCHAVGDSPATAAFEARGVNFSYFLARLRYDFYSRWMLDPPRIEVSTKMPKLAADGVPTRVYNGDARKQFDAIWHYLQTLKNDQ